MLKLKPLAQRRFTSHFTTKPKNSLWALDDTHDAIINKKTLFPSTVVKAIDAPRLLVAGINSRKTGNKVQLGRWEGSPIFTLTLEERATCPSTCHHWKTCYGNGMPMARRHEHGEEFEQLLEMELHALNLKHESFVVRLHILGDFYSVAYVEKWRHWLNIFSGLKVFGYTARDQYTEIGKAIYDLRQAHWNKFAIRFSRSRPEDFEREAVSGDSPLSSLGSIQCPAQTNNDKFCGNCSACWESDKNILFASHGRNLAMFDWEQNKKLKSFSVEIGRFKYLVIPDLKLKNRFHWIAYTAGIQVGTGGPFPLVKAKKAAEKDYAARIDQAQRIIKSGKYQK